MRAPRAHTLCAGDSGHPGVPAELAGPSLRLCPSLPRGASGQTSAFPAPLLPQGVCSLRRGNACPQRNPLLTREDISGGGGALSRAR